MRGVRMSSMQQHLLRVHAASMPLGSLGASMSCRVGPCGAQCNATSCPLTSFKHWGSKFWLPKAQHLVESPTATLCCHSSSTRPS